MVYNDYNDNWADVKKASHEKARAAIAAEKEKCVGSKDVDNQIKKAIDNIVGGASEDADTLKELDDKIKTIDAGSNGYSKAESDAKYQPKGDYLTGDALNEYAKKTELSNFATKAELDALEDKIPDTADFALKSEIPTKTSELTNDSNFLTSHQDISGLATKT